MSWLERPDAKRLVVIATFLESRPHLPAPTVIGPNFVAWHITGRPSQEALVLSIVSNWKVVRVDGEVASLGGYHTALGDIRLHTDAHAAGAVPRDWAALGIAVAGAVAS